MVIFLGSSTVEHPAVNRRVVGSNPTRGADNFQPFGNFAEGLFILNLLQKKKDFFKTLSNI